MTADLTIESPSEMRKPIIFPWARNYKCKEHGYFFDGTYGYFGINSYSKDLWNKWLNITLNWLGFYTIWRCDGSGKWTIKRREYQDSK